MAGRSKEDLGQAEVQKERDEVAAKGHVGYKPDGPPNAAYSLTTGPDSPSALDVARASAERRAESMKGGEN